MAGVAGPMVRVDRRAAARFLAGLLIGGVAGSVLLAVPVYVLGQFVGVVAGEEVRWALFGAVVVGFALIDLAQRTPHVQRQVPQRLVRSVKPGRLGLVWGVDLATLFSTQKTTSLPWAMLAGLVLVAPGAAPVVLPAAWTVAWAAMVVLTVRRSRSLVAMEEHGQWDDLVRILRWSSGSVMLGTVVLGVLVAT
jgi:hypothetical protein